MSLGTCFDLLSRIVERYESDGGSVRAVEASTDDDRTVRATITVSAVPGTADGHVPTLVAESASVNDEGGVEVSFSASHLTEVVGRTDASVDAEIRGASSTDDGELVLTVAVVIRASTGASEVAAADDADADGGRLATEEGSDGDEEAAGNGVETPDGDDGTERGQIEAVGCADGESASSPSVAEELAAVRDESVPPYEDTEYLGRLYERCETFTEMTRLIEMAVASETVRRYMIEAGVHSPTSYDTAPQTRESEGDTPSEAAPEPSPDAVGAEKLVTDGIGLPNSVRIPDVVDAVVVSVTLYGFARRVGLEQEDARELLQQLNLLDFVPRRLPTGRKQELSHEDVAERIRRCTGSA